MEYTVTRQIVIKKDIEIEASNLEELEEKISEIFSKEYLDIKDYEVEDVMTYYNESIKKN